MMKGMRLTFAMAVLGLPLAATAQAEAPSLKGTGEIVITSGGGSWEDAQKKAYFEPFEKETGIKVVLVPEDHAKLLASVEAGKPEADITSINAGQLGGFLTRGAVQKIDYKYFDEETLAGMPAILKNEFGVGSVLYSVVMAYNEAEYPAGKPRPQTWAEFFDTRKFPGPRGLARCEKIIDGGTLEIASLATGVANDALYPLDMDKAFAKLEELKPEVGKWWQSGAEAPQGLIDGELAVSSAWNGRIYGAKKKGAPVDLNWNQSLIQYDYWVVMKGSPNYDNVMKFLAFFARAKPQADFAIEIAYGPVNEKAYDFIPADLAQWLPGSPVNVKQQIYQDYTWWNAKGADGKTNWDTALARCLTMLSQ